MLIVIISFVKIGSADTMAQNNGFLCLIVCCILYWLQIKINPFITEDLNHFNNVSNFLMITTIFLGIFSSVSQNLTLETIIMGLILVLNCFLMIIVFKKLLIFKVSFTNESKLIVYLRDKANIFWSKGSFKVFLSFLLFFF